MASIRNGLKEILVAIGKTPESKSTSGLIDEIADAIQTAAEGDGIIVNILELPAVTATDNGRVLGVVNGQWAVMDISSFIQDSTAS